MTHASARRRPSRTAAGVLAAAALTGLASLPAVAVAAEPDLGIGPLAPVTGAQPGSGVDVPFSVLNKGTEEAGKVWVTYSVTRGSTPRRPTRTACTRRSRPPMRSLSGRSRCVRSSSR